MCNALLLLNQSVVSYHFVAQGLLLRSIMDKGLFCWYCALHDEAEAFGGKKNIFGLIESVSPTRAINVSRDVSIRMFYLSLPSGANT